MTGLPSEFALEGRGLRVRLGEAEVLHGVDVRFARGRWTSVVGPNGAGKSTLLRSVAGLLPCRGDVVLDGQSLVTLEGRARARRLSWLGQAETGADDLSVWDVAMLGRVPHQAWLAAPSPEDRAAVQRALEATQAWDWRERALGELSAGERQRVLLARALAVEADTMLMDEPLANLDPPHQADWLALVRSRVAAGATVVAVLHELSFALAADDMVVLREGRVVHQGPCAQTATHRALESVFGDRIEVREVEGRLVALPRL